MSKWIDDIFESEKTLRNCAHDIRSIARAMEVLGMATSERLFDVADAISSAGQTIINATAKEASDGLRRTEESTASIFKAFLETSSVTPDMSTDR